MNEEFNPFEYYGINPNGKSIEEIRRMNIPKNYYNPFLQQDAAGTTIDNSDGFSNFEGLAKSKDDEIMNRLNVNIQPKMSEEERWDYVNSLSDEDWRTFNNLKRQGYNFEQRKTLMDNRDKLSNIKEDGEEKYYDDKGFLAGLRDAVQRYINTQESFSTLSDSLDDYWYSWMDEQPYKDKVGAKIANTLESIPSWFLEALGTEKGLEANAIRGVGNTLIKGANLLGANIQPLEKGENYQTNLNLGTEAIREGLEGAGIYYAPVLYGFIGTLSQTDTRAGKGLQGVDGFLEYAASQIERSDKLMELAKQPGNEDLIQNIESIIKYAGYYVLTLGTKRITKAERIKIKNKLDTGADKLMNGLREGTQEGIKRGQEATKVMEDIGETETKRIYDTKTGKWIEDNNTLTKGGKQTVREEAWQGFKEGFKRGWKIDKAMKPYTEPVKGTYGAEGFALKGPESIPGETDTTVKQESGWMKDIFNKGEQIITGLPDDLLKKVKGSSVLQEGYNRIVKPFLQSGEKDFNKVIEKSLSTLKAYLGNKIPEYRNAVSKGLKTKGNQKDINFLNKVEEMLDMDFMKTFEYFSNLTKSQKALLEKVAPGFSKQLDFIGNIYELTKNLGTNKDWITKYLSHKSKSGRKWSLTGFAKRQMYKLLNKMWEGGKNRIKRISLDEFIKGLKEEDIKKLNDLLQKEYNNENFSKADKAFLDSLKKNFEKEEMLKMKENGEDEGYMEKTMKKYESPRNIKEVLNEKMPGQNKTLGQYFEDKGVQLSIARENSTLRTIAKDDVLGAYDALVDRIYTTEQQKWRGVLLHEFFHRVLWQLNTSEILKHLDYIEKKTGLKESEAIERFAEYGRNFLETGDIDGKPIENTLIRELGRKDGTALYTAMKQVKNEMSKLFNMEEGEKNLYQLFNDIKYDTEKGQEITSKKPVALKNRTGEDPGLKTKEDIAIQEKGKYGEGKFDKDTGRNQNDLDKLVLKQKMDNIRDFGFLKEPESKYDSYLKEIRKEIPDVVGLTIKDGKLAVRFLIESGWERWEQADRPGQREIHEIQAYDFFTEEEKSKFSKELQELIGNRGENVDNEGNPLSSQQEKYFKDSKVRDKNGNLLLVFHGTRDSRFEEFNWDMIGSSNGNEGYFGKGFYFTPDKQVARDYMDTGRSDNESIKGMKVGYLNIKKLFDFDKTYTKKEYENLLKELKVTKEQLPASENNGKYRLMNGYDLKVFNEGEWDMEEFQKMFGDVDLDLILQGEDLTNILEKAGYDGTLGNNGLYDEYVIFNSNQFKEITNRTPSEGDNFKDPVDLDELKKETNIEEIKKLQEDIDYRHHRAMKAERGAEFEEDSELPKKEYDGKGNKEELQKDLDYRHHRAMVAEKSNDINALKEPKEPKQPKEKVVFTPQKSVYIEGKINDWRTPVYSRRADHEQIDTKDLKWNIKGDLKDITQPMKIKEFFKDPNGLYYINDEPLGLQIDMLEGNSFDKYNIDKVTPGNKRTLENFRKLNNTLPKKWRDIANQQLDIILNELKKEFEEKGYLMAWEEQLLGVKREKDPSLNELLDEENSILWGTETNSKGQTMEEEQMSKSIMQQKYEILKELEELSDPDMMLGGLTFEEVKDTLERPNLDMFKEEFSDFFDENDELIEGVRRTPVIEYVSDEDLLKEINQIKTTEDLDEHIKKHYGKNYTRTSTVSDLLKESDIKFDTYHKLDDYLWKVWPDKFDRLGEFLYIPKAD